MYQLGHFLAEQKAILSSQEDMSLFGTQGNNYVYTKEIGNTHNVRTTLSSQISV